MIACPTKNLPVLVTGLAGVPGYNLFHYLKKRHPADVYGIRPSHQPGLHFSGVLSFDAENLHGLEAFIKKTGISTLFDASGCCALKSCEYNPEMAEMVNVKQGVGYAEISRELGLRLIRLSTDMVFPGREEGMYRESDTVAPITVYGKSMARAEELILKTCSEATIVRIPLPMAPSFSGHAGAIDWIRHRFHKGLPATLYFDEVRSSFYLQDLIRVLLWLCEYVPHLTTTGNRTFRERAAGIFHFGGSRPLSLYQIAQIINRLGSYAPELLMGCPRREAGPIPPRIGNVSLDCSLLESHLNATRLDDAQLKAILGGENSGGSKQRVAPPPKDSGRKAGLRKTPLDCLGPGHRTGPTDSGQNHWRQISGLRKTPADFPGPWPREDRFVPTHREWHFEREPEDGSIEKDLYGYAGGGVEHPLEWLPSPQINGQKFTSIQRAASVSAPTDN